MKNLNQHSIHFTSLKDILNEKTAKVKGTTIDIFQGEQFLFTMKKNSNNNVLRNIVTATQTATTSNKKPRRKVTKHTTSNKSLQFRNQSLQSFTKSTRWNVVADDSDDIVDEAMLDPYNTTRSYIEMRPYGKLCYQRNKLSSKWHRFVSAKKLQVAVTHATNSVVANHANVKKSATTFDKLFAYYRVSIPRAMYAHKAFVALEMQLSSMLLKTQLVPYQHMVEALCFYDLVRINGVPARNAHYVLSLYDSLSIPAQLHSYMNLRNNRIVSYPHYVRQFFKQYWNQTVNFNSNKIWLLSNFVKSDVTAEAIIFDYPNPLLYMAPFARFTKLYYDNSSNLPAQSSKHEWLNYSHTVFKLKLFEFASYYK